MVKKSGVYKESGRVSSPERKRNRSKKKELAASDMSNKN